MDPVSLKRGNRIFILGNDFDWFYSSLFPFTNSPGFMPNCFGNIWRNKTDY